MAPMLWLRCCSSKDRPASEGAQASGRVETSYCECGCFDCHRDEVVPALLASRWSCSPYSKPIGAAAHLSEVVAYAGLSGSIVDKDHGPRVVQKLEIAALPKGSLRSTAHDLCSGTVACQPASRKEEPQGSKGRASDHAHGPGSSQAPNSLESHKRSFVENWTPHTIQNLQS